LKLYARFLVKQLPVLVVRAKSKYGRANMRRSSRRAAFSLFALPRLSADLAQLWGKCGVIASDERFDARPEHHPACAEFPAHQLTIAKKPENSFVGDTAQKNGCLIDGMSEGGYRRGRRHE